MTQSVGKIKAISVRIAHGQPPKLIDGASAPIDGHLDGDHGKSVKRGITFISDKQWQDVCNEIDADLPWQTRRANVLVETDTLEHLIGKEIMAGSIKLLIHEETKPCNLMDTLHPKLQDALQAECRGGILGQVIEAGELKIGDEITIV